MAFRTIIIKSRAKLELRLNTLVIRGDVEKIICYINALIEIKSCRTFVFLNLKSFLNDEELVLLYKHCLYEKVGLLLIENFKVRNLLPNEKAIIITNDLCEIVENC